MDIFFVHGEVQDLKVPVQSETSIPFQMEREEDYQRVQSFLAQLEALHDRLDEREVMKAYSETTKQIVLQFDEYLLALAIRKEQLLREAENKLQEQKNLILLQQNQLKTEIEGSKRILEGGSLLYESNRSVAISIWKNVAALSHPKLDEGIIGVEFPSLLETIAAHGRVTVDSKRVTCNKAGFVTTLANPDNGELQQYTPSAIHFNPVDDCLFVCDTSSNTIKRIALKGGTIVTSKDAGSLRSLGGIAFHHKSNSGYVVDKYSHSIKKLTSTWLGMKAESFVGDGRMGNKDGVGMHATFNSPSDVTVNQQTGDLYVSDLGNHSIRKITPQANFLAGVATTIAGSGASGSQDGVGRAAQFKEPTGISFCEKTQSIYVCDDNKVRVVSLINAEVTTVPFTFDSPYGLLVVADGAVLVTSFTEHKIMKVVRQGKGQYDVSVAVGSDEGKEDGIPEKCRLNGPTGITYDERTNTCYIAEFGNRCIRRFSLV